MRKAAPIVVLIAGILVLIGMSLPWGNVSFGESLYFSVSASFSGWDYLGGEPEGTLAFIGGLLLILCGVSALVVPTMTENGRGAIRALGTVASISAVLVIIGGVWAILSILSHSPPSASFLGYEVSLYEVSLGSGAFITIIFAVPGLIFGIVTSKSAKGGESLKQLVGGKLEEIEPDYHRVVKFCPNCGEQVIEKATYCSACGQELIKPQAGRTDDVRCPECGSETVMRTAKKGPNAGRRFHVCTRYPDCKGKVPIKKQE